MNLPPGDIDLFYKLHGSLLAFANQQLKILPANTAPNQVRKQPIRQVAGLRNACYDNSAIFDHISREPEQALVGRVGHRRRLAAPRRWRTFYIVRYLKVYTVFMILEEPAHLYGVSALLTRWRSSSTARRCPRWSRPPRCRSGIASSTMVSLPTLTAFSSGPQFVPASTRPTAGSRNAKGSLRP